MTDQGEDAEWHEQRRRWRALDEIAQAHAAEFIGLSAEAANALAGQLGLHLRLIDLDENAWYTQAYEFGRITAFAKHGVVTECSAG